MAFSSSGALPKQMVEIFLRNGRPDLWSSVFVGCSGTFRTERALLKARPSLIVHSCDVSLFSTSIARLAMGKPIDFCFTGDLAFIEDAELDQESRVAAIMVASKIGQYALGKTNRYKEAHLVHLRATSRNTSRTLRKSLSRSPTICRSRVTRRGTSWSTSRKRLIVAPASSPFRRW